MTSSGPRLERRKPGIIEMRIELYRQRLELSWILRRFDGVMTGSRYTDE